jgi:hypothetical protein
MVSVRCFGSTVACVVKPNVTSRSLQVPQVLQRSPTCPVSVSSGATAVLGGVSGSGLSRPRKGKKARALGASATRASSRLGSCGAERALVPLQVPEARKDTYRKLLTRLVRYHGHRELLTRMPAVASDRGSNGATVFGEQGAARRVMGRVRVC